MQETERLNSSMAEKTAQLREAQLPRSAEIQRGYSAEAIRIDGPDDTAMGVRNAKDRVTHHEPTVTKEPFYTLAGYKPVQGDEMHRQHNIPANGLPIHKMAMPPNRVFKPLGRGNPKDQNIVQQMDAQDSDAVFPRADGKPYGEHDFIDLGSLQDRLTKTKKWDEFKNLVKREGEEFERGTVMENWEDDAHMWAAYSRQLLEREKGARKRADENEEEVQRKREADKEKRKLPFNPSSGMSPYWPGVDIKPNQVVQNRISSKMHEAELAEKNDPAAQQMNAMLRNLPSSGRALRSGQEAFPWGEAEESEGSNDGHGGAYPEAAGRYADRLREGPGAYSGGPGAFPASSSNSGGFGAFPGAPGIGGGDLRSYYPQSFGGGANSQGFGKGGNPVAYQQGYVGWYQNKRGQGHLVTMNGPPPPPGWKKSYKSSTVTPLDLPPERGLKDFRPGDKEQSEPLELRSDSRWKDLKRGIHQPMRPPMLWSRRQFELPALTGDDKVDEEYNDNEEELRPTPKLPPIYYKNRPQDVRREIPTGRDDRYLTPEQRSEESPDYDTGPNFSEMSQHFEKPRIAFDEHVNEADVPVGYGKIPGPGSEGDFPNGYRPNYGSDMKKPNELNGVAQPQSGRYPEAQPNPFIKSPPERTSNKHPPQFSAGSQAGGGGDYPDMQALRMGGPLAQPRPGSESRYPGGGFPTMSKTGSNGDYPDMQALQMGGSPFQSGPGSGSRYPGGGGFPPMNKPGSNGDYPDMQALRMGGPSAQPGPGSGSLFLDGFPPRSTAGSDAEYAEKLALRMGAIPVQPGPGAELSYPGMFPPMNRAGSNGAYPDMQALRMGGQPVQPGPGYESRYPGGVGFPPMNKVGSNGDYPDMQALRMGGPPAQLGLGFESRFPGGYHPKIPGGNMEMGAPLGNGQGRLLQRGPPPGRDNNPGSSGWNPDKSWGSKGFSPPGEPAYQLPLGPDGLPPGMPRELMKAMARSRPRHGAGDVPITYPDKKVVGDQEGFQPREGVPNGYGLLQIAMAKTMGEEQMLRVGPTSTPPPTSKRPPTIEERLKKLRQYDDFGAPIRWVQLTSEATSDGLAKVTDKDTQNNQQFLIEGVLYVPVVDESMARLGLTTEDYDEGTTVSSIRIPANDSSIKTILRSMNLNQSTELEWLAYETVLGPKKLYENQCDEDSCQARCYKPSCGTVCVGVSCNAFCKGPGCFAMCIGEKCTAKCEGMNCESRCWGKECDASCKLLSCAYIVNGDSRTTNSTWDQLYPNDDQEHQNTPHQNSQPAAPEQSSNNKNQKDDYYYD